MNVRRWLVAVLVVFALLVTGCGGDDSAGKPGDAGATGPEVVNYTQSAKMKVKVDGRHKASFDGSSDLVVLRAAGIGSTPLITVGTNGLVLSAEGFQVEVYATVVDYEKDGDYTINPPPTSGGKPSLASNAYVTMFRGTTKENLEAGRFDEVAAACKATIKQGGSEGKVVCPKLLEPGSKDAISVTFEWKGTGPKVDKMPATTTTAGA